jgi:RNA polymerase sigma factor (sigma-70 family)
MSSRVGSGDETEFVSWLRTNGGHLLRSSYYYTRDPRLGEEIAQDAATKIFKAWSRDAMREKILSSPAYVRSIVYHCYLDHIKVPSRTTRGEVELDVARLGELRTEGDSDLHVAVLSLDRSEQQMIAMRYYDDLTIKEAGRQLGLSYPQACRLHARALAHLRELLDEGED